MKRSLWIIVAFAVIAGAAVLHAVRADEALAPQGEIDKPKAGYAAPVVELPDLNGAKVTVGGASGKLTLVNFWASWCGPCDIEMPDLQSLHERFGDRLNVYGVNATSYDREREARAFVEEKELTFPILMDREGTAVDRYKVGQFPTSLLLDGQGGVLERVTGVIDRKAWEKLIQKYGNAGS